MNYVIAQKNPRDGTDAEKAEFQKAIDLGLPVMNGGKFDEARSLFQQALDLARREKSTVTEMKVHLAFGRLYYQMNDNDAAIAELQTALNFYQPAGYPRETSIALTVLGRAYQDKGEDETALHLFQEQSELVFPRPHI